jgi:hypothetical protein
MYSSIKLHFIKILVEHMAHVVHKGQGCIISYNYIYLDYSGTHGTRGAQGTLMYLPLKLHLLRF